jgi:hypothetical protein
MNRTTLNTNVRKHLSDSHRVPLLETASIYSNTNRIIVDHKDAYIFTVVDTQTHDQIEIQVVPFGRRCMIRINTLGWYDLVKFAKLHKIEPIKGCSIEQSDNESSAIKDGILIFCDNNDHLEITGCSLNMFGYVMQELKPYVEKYIDNYHQDISDIYDSYKPMVRSMYPVSRPVVPNKSNIMQRPMLPTNSVTDNLKREENSLISSSSKKKKTDLWKLNFGVK